MTSCRSPDGNCNTLSSSVYAFSNVHSIRNGHLGSENLKNYWFIDVDWRLRRSLDANGFFRHAKISWKMLRPFAQVLQRPWPDRADWFSKIQRLAWEWMMWIFIDWTCGQPMKRKVECEVWMDVQSLAIYLFKTFATAQRSGLSTVRAALAPMMDSQHTRQYSARHPAEPFSWL